MKNKTLAKILSVATSGVMLFSAGSVYLSHSERNQDGTYNVSEENREELLGISDENEYFLGAASQFSVFLHDDFAAYGSDCEGRLAAGGNANVGDPVSYSVGARLPEGFSAAQIVVGGDTLTNFQPENKKFVVGSKGNISPEILNHMNDGQTEVYIGKLIDFDKEFALLRERSEYLANQTPNAQLQVDEYYASGWKIVGTDDNLNVLNLTEEQMKTFNNGYIDMSVQIPEGSYLVINVP
ncbi:MAG: choice-of-anchor A family protein, partial [Ruminococcus flavefaciens]